MIDPEAAVDQLAACRGPYVIGIRHHSPVLAGAIPRLLEAANPDVLFVELPEEVQDWLPWLGHPEAETPLALAASRRDGQGLVFYPYADFSPELAAIRWAQARGIAVLAFDLPVGLGVGDTPRSRTRLAPSRRAPVSDALRKVASADDADELWDRTIEVRAVDADAESIRRAALAVGWSLRLEQETWGAVPQSDLRRESWMRRRLRESTAQRPAAVVGAFHVSALLNVDAAPSEKVTKHAAVVTSLVPYTFEQLDSRTGYPAGIRDPEWQQAIWHGGATSRAVGRTVARLAVRVCRELRRRGHPASVADAREVIRFATDLSRLRGLAAPGRRELVEAMQAALAQGEPLGRGRAVAAAMQTVLVGHRRGRLAMATPRSGLGPHVEELLAELRLPGPGQHDPLDIRLDPLRSGLDRRRHVTLQRLIACGIPYAMPISVDDNLLTGRWVLRWTAATSARLELSNHRGVTLEQAAEGGLRARLAAAAQRDGPTARQTLDILRDAAECGLVGLATELLRGVERALASQATIPELVQALELCDRLLRGHVAGYEPAPDVLNLLSTRVLPALQASAVASLDGLAGSESLDDARALLALSQRVGLDHVQLRFGLRFLEREGAPLIQGAASATRALLGDLPTDAFGERLASSLDSSDQSALARRLAGTLSLAAPLLEAAPRAADGLIERIAGMEDAAFLQRLPALRDGFEVLSPAARQRFMDALRPRLSASFDARLDEPAALLARWAEADAYGRAVVEAELPAALAGEGSA